VVCWSPIVVDVVDDVVVVLEDDVVVVLVLVVVLRGTVLVLVVVVVERGTVVEVDVVVLVVDDVVVVELDEVVGAAVVLVDGTDCGTVGPPGPSERAGLVVVVLVGGTEGVVCVTGTDVVVAPCRRAVVVVSGAGGRVVGTARGRVEDSTTVDDVLGATMTLVLGTDEEGPGTDEEVEVDRVGEVDVVGEVDAVGEVGAVGAVVGGTFDAVVVVLEAADVDAGLSATLAGARAATWRLSWFVSAMRASNLLSRERTSAA